MSYTTTQYISKHIDIHNHRIYFAIYTNTQTMKIIHNIVIYLHSKYFKIKSHTEPQKLFHNMFMQGLKFVYFSSFIFQQRVASPDAMVCRQLGASVG